jgi:hypothetical protein
MLLRAPALVDGNVEHVELWIQVLTGMELDQRGGTRAHSMSGTRRVADHGPPAGAHIPPQAAL